MSGTVKLQPRAVRAEAGSVWALNSEAGSQSTATLAETSSSLAYRRRKPFPMKCEAYSQPNAVCCKTLKDEQERQLVNSDIVKDIIIGLSDGLTVPFGLTAGLSAIGSSHVIVIGGVAELISGSLSMGVGGFLSAMAERDHYRYIRDWTRARIKRSCIGELEREVTEALGEVGLEEALCRRIALRLIKLEKDVEAEREKLLPSGSSSRSYDIRQQLQHFLHTLTRNPRTSHDIEETSSLRRFPDQVGLTAFLLRFAEGEEEVPNSRLFISAFTIGFSYALGGLIPLLPYIIEHDTTRALYISIGVTGLALIIFGIIKAYYTGSRIGFLGYTKSAIYTLAIGALAAGSAYGISRAIERGSSGSQ